MNKRGVSPIIATVLVILITILAAGIIAPFVINFVNDNLDDSGSCFEVVGDLEFASTQFNCYNMSAGPGGNNTGFSVKINNEAIEGFRISLVSLGSSQEYDIVNGTSDPNLRMLTDTTTGGDLSVPERGGTRTYVVEGTAYESAEIAPILADGKCGVADTIIFTQCTGTDAMNLVG